MYSSLVMPAGNAAPTAGAPGAAEGRCAAAAPPAAADAAVTVVPAAAADAAAPAAAPAAVDGAPAADAARDATRLCLVTRAREVDGRGRAAREVVARLATTLLVVDAKKVGRAFDAAALGEWCTRTAGAGGEAGPRRRAVGIRRESGWEVELRAVRRGVRHMAGRGAVVWRVALEWRGAGGKDGITLDFGEREEAASEWFETLRGTVTPWETLLGFAKEDAAVEEAAVARAAGARGGALRDGDAMPPVALDGKAREVPAPAPRRRNVPNLVPSGGALVTGRAPRAAALFLLKRRLPATPPVFIATRALGYVYKRRFSIKTALVRTPAQRAYAQLHHVRLAHMHELLAAGAGTAAAQPLAADVEEIEACLRRCDEYLIGGRGLVTGLIGTPAVFRDAGKVAARLGEREFVRSEKWAGPERGSVHSLLRSTGSSAPGV